MTSLPLRPLAIKEIRALAPIWLASVCAMVAAAAGGFRGDPLGLSAYTFGAVALGAHTVGHEYAHHTLAMILSQPSSRARLFLIKLGALLLMLLTLTAVAGITVLGPGQVGWVASTLLASVCLAPLLAMACRTTIAGPVFAGALPFWISVLSRLLGARVVWGVTAAVCALSALAIWRLFMRLEAIDGRGSDLRLPDSWHRAPSVTAASGDRARTRHPVWLLVKKELHLQQMTFAVAGLWAAIWVSVFALAPFVPQLPEFPLAGVGVLYGALLAVLIGSLASAEERQNSTLEWQVLLPMAAWKQWAVKVGTVLTLTALLSYLFPLALAAGRIGIYGWHAGWIVLLTTGSLYISSLCRTTVRALIVSGAVMLILVVLSQYFYVISSWPSPLLAAPFAVVVALLLWRGFENHRRTA